MTHAVLDGLIPILATPFTEQGALDEDSLRRLTRFQLGAGAEGLAVFGIASEAFALDSEERQRILALVKAELAGAIPLVAGIGSTGVRPALEQVHEAVDGGADALMVLPPFLVKPPPDRLVEFFALVAAAATVPIMVQDAPDVTGVAMSTETVARLAEIPGVEYVKIEATPSPVKVDAVRRATASGIRIFGGKNAQYLLEELERGAVGSMPACEFTDILADVFRHVRAARSADAQAAFSSLLPLLLYGLQSGIAWAVHKHVLVRREVITSSRVRLPASELDQASVAGLERLLGPLMKQPGWRWSGAS